MLKHGILGLLNYGDMTGYEIMTAFRDSLQFFWSANTSQIYRELQSLKQNGYVTDSKVSQQGKPDKNIFSITESGKAELKEWLKVEEYGKQNMGMLMKVFFAGELDAEENIARFDHIAGACTQFLAGLDKAETMSDQYKQVLKETDDKAIYWKMTISFGRKYMQMMKEWSEECKKELEMVRRM